MRRKNLPPIVGPLLATLLTCCGAVTTARADANRLFRDLSFAETISERYQICENLDPESVPPYAALFCQAYRVLASGQDSLAARLLENALRLRPDLAVGCVLFADGYLERSELEPAARWYRRALSIAPDRLDPHYGLGLIGLRRAAVEGNAAYEEALASFREMTRIDPASPDGWANVGMVLAILDRHEEAQASYEKALSIAPDDPGLHYSLGSLASRRGNDAAAVSHWRRAIEIDPAEAAAARELAALCGRQGTIEEAIQVLEAAVQAAHVGEAAGKVRQDLGLLYLLADRLDRAGELLEEARVLSPDGRTLCALGHLRMLQGSTEAALLHFTGAAAADSAIVRPFLDAWAIPLKTASETSRGEAPGAGPAGREATGSLVRALLPDWQLPEGLLEIPGLPGEAAYDTAPVPVFRAMATYPETAAGIGGTVAILVRIDEHGIVRDAEVVGKGGNPALDGAALEAAKKWRFEPARLRGKPVPCEVTIPFRFSGSR